MSKKYRVQTVVTGTFDFGLVSADSEEEAIEKAFAEYGNDTVSLCWHCSKEVGELTISCNCDDIEVEEILPEE